MICRPVSRLSFLTASTSAVISSIVNSQSNRELRKYLTLLTKRIFLSSLSIFIVSTPHKYKFFQKRTVNISEKFLFV